MSRLPVMFWLSVLGWVAWSAAGSAAAFADAGAAPTPNSGIDGEPGVVRPAPVSQAPVATAITSRPQLDPQDPRHFLMDGQPWYPVGYYPGLGTFTIRNDPLYPYMTEFLDKAAAQGINYCRLVVSLLQGYGDLASYESIPYLRVGTVSGDGFTFPQVDLDQFNQAHFDYVRSVLEYARDKGIVVQTCMLDSWHINNVELPWHRKYDFLSPGMNVNGVAVNTGAEWHSTNTSSVAWQRHTALVRKIIDTFGDLPNIIWEVSNEPNYYYDGQIYPDRPPPVNDWAMQMGSYIKTYEFSTRGYNHICAGPDFPDHQHTAGQRPNFFATAPNETDGHTPTGTHRDLLYQWANDIPAVLPQPLIADNDAGGTDLSPDDARRKGWACLTAAAHISYFHYTLGDYNVLRSQDVTDRMRYLGFLNKFIGDLSVNLQGMVPADNLVTSGWCCARSGDEYVVYLMTGGTTSVSSLPGAYTARWFNPRTGVVQPAAGGPSFTAPDSNDWVLHLKSGGPTPYHGTPAPVPGVIQAEDYDLGGEGVAYHDTTAGNSGGAYRSEDVDIESTSDAGSGFDVTATAAGEWMEYSVSVTETGVYAAGLRAAAAAAGGSVSLQLDGAALAGPVGVPATGGPQVWQKVLIPDLQLTAGTHHLRVFINAGGFNLNWIDVEFALRRVDSDFDRDGDVDLSDFGLLQQCFSGLSSIQSGCEQADLNGDSKVNADDLPEFLECLAGPQIQSPCALP